MHSSTMATTGWREAGKLCMNYLAIGNSVDFSDDWGRGKCTSAEERTVRSYKLQGKWFVRACAVGAIATQN